MKPKILKVPYNHICLYCGKEIPVNYEEYNEYYECDCPDAKKEREIKRKIENLKRQIPEKKYSINQKNVLYKNDD